MNVMKPAFITWASLRQNLPSEFPTRGTQNHSIDGPCTMNQGKPNTISTCFSPKKQQKIRRRAEHKNIEHDKGKQHKGKLCILSNFSCFFKFVVC